MIRSNQLSRIELVDLIRKSPKTHDGYYFFPRFPTLLMSKGNIKDNGYHYDRSIFKDKMAFTEEEIRVFLAKRSIKFDFMLMRLVDSKLKEAIKGYEFLCLKDIVLNKEYSLEELIDTTIYLIKYKYS